MSASAFRIAGAPPLAVDVAGQGEMVLFLHGIGGNRKNWTRQLSCLADGYCVVSLDMRGYGESGDYTGKPRFQDFCRDVLRVMEALRRPTAHIVGLSLGGMIAQDFYRRHPARVGSLVLADTRNTYLRHDNDRFLQARLKPLVEGKAMADIAARLADEIAGPHASPEARRELLDSLSRLRKESYMKTLIAATHVGEDPEFTGRTDYVDLESIEVPCMVVCGEFDHITPPDQAREMARRIEGGSFAIIPGAGHLSNIENPDAFNQCMRAFLDNLPRDGNTDWEQGK